MIRFLRDALRQLDRRPLPVAALVGALLAWPLDPSTTWWWALPGVLGALSIVSADADRPRASGGARLLTSLGVALVVAPALAQRPTEPAFGLGLAIAATWALLYTWRTTDRARRRDPDRTRWTTRAALVTAIVLVSVPAALPLPRVAVLLTLGAALLLLLVARPRAMHATNVPDLLLASPARLFVASFASLALFGAVLLLLPIASTAPGSVRLIDALFTAVSATCVTGLIVLDTPHDFTLYGQAVIAVLFQLGGLGIMTFAAAAAVYLGRRLGVREESMAADLMGGAGARRDLESALRAVLKVTFWTESLGVLALTPQFMAHGDSLGVALWRAVFTSISAFCNAGFALQSNSLMDYQGSPGVLLTVSALIVVGGLGPLVVVALPALRRGRSTLHVRLVVTSTLGLLVAPMFLFLFLEWNSTLANMALGDKVVNAWFQSVTLRTAGFNSIDFADIQPATWTLAILCMFVGGSPGSTAGGVKTTTMAVLILAVIAAIRGRLEASAFGRRIPHRTVYEATAITTAGVLSAAAALMAVQVTQDIALDHALFEVVSALGTVGLSMGATGSLDDVGKVLVIASMFAGRVGPLTLFIVLIGQSRGGHRYPIETVQVG